MKTPTTLILLAFSLWSQQGSDSPPATPDSPPPKIEVLKTTIVITAKPVEPRIDRRNSEVFTRTLFSRDDQIFHLLDAGINAAQHGGGGKSLEFRLFGVTRDHAGVNGWP